MYIFTTIPQTSSLFKIKLLVNVNTEEQLLYESPATGGQHYEKDKDQGQDKGGARATMVHQCSNNNDQATVMGMQGEHVCLPSKVRNVFGSCFKILLLVILPIEYSLNPLGMEF